MNFPRISGRLRLPLIVAVGGCAMTVALAGYFRLEADRLANDQFELRSKRYALTVQMCLQEAVSAARGIRSIAENGLGGGIESLRALSLLGEGNDSPIHGIRWIAFLALSPARADVPVADDATPIVGLAASRGAPIAEGGQILQAPHFLRALQQAMRSGNATLYVPENESGIDTPVYLGAIKTGTLRAPTQVLAVGLEVKSLVGADMAEFLARDNQPPIGTYAIKIFAKSAGDGAAIERILVQTAKHGPIETPSPWSFAAGDSTWFERESQIEIDGLRYRIHTAISRAEIDTPEDKNSWWALAIGLLTTLILCLTTARIALARDVAVDTSRQLGTLVRRSESRFRNLVESTRDWMWETDAQGVFTFSSGRVHALLGVSPREIIGKRCIDLGLQMDLEHAAASDARMEIAVAHRDGQIAWLQCACSRFNDDQGALAGYRGVCTDITETRARTDRQRSLEIEFNRTDKLGTLDHVMSMVAHELNQPLAAVASYCGASVRMLRDDPQALDEAIASMNAAAKQAQVAAATVRGIRQFIVQQEPSIASHGADTLIRNAITLAAFRVDQAGIKIEWTHDPRLPPVLADQILIVQVLLNLLHNAIDAVSECRDPRIWIRAEQADAAWVRILVEDNGPGMDEEQLARCFEPYVTTKKSGLGLGLSISQSIVESHQGQLSMRRNAQGGCAAILTLKADGNADGASGKSKLLARRDG
ncbi:MAG: sensor histidine kinase [Burkholderiales bacterium]